MRSIGLFLALVTTACGGEATYVIACDGSAPMEGGGDVASPDASDAPTDSPHDALADACGSKTFAIAGKCAAGSDCDGGVCCSTLEFDESCFLTKFSAACAAPASCRSAFQPFCGGNETARLCDSPSDCTEPGFDRCCTFPIRCTANTLVMCASEAAAKAAGGSCL